MQKSTGTTTAKDPKDRRLTQLVERYRHELMPYEERCELEDRIVRLRRKLRAS